jgi:hypothetical protein
MDVVQLPLVLDVVVEAGDHLLRAPLHAANLSARRIHIKPRPARVA